MRTHAAGSRRQQAIRASSVDALRLALMVGREMACSGLKVRDWLALVLERRGHRDGHGHVRLRHVELGGVVGVDIRSLCGAVENKAIGRRSLPIV
eukprot:6180685-Pleurochrysis_carterae.AAC.1